jgi:hypothetical protein
VSSVLSPYIIAAAKTPILVIKFNRRLDGMLKILLCCYIALMPFLHALSPLPILALNSLILIVAGPFVIASRIPNHYDFSSGNIFTLFVVLYGVLAWLWTPYDIELSRWQAALQWSFSGATLWILVRRWIIVSQIRFDLISTVSFYAAIFLSISTIAEFILVNYNGVFFSDLIPFSIDNFTDANIFTSNIMRPRVFTAEAGFTAMVFELFIPISAQYFIRSGINLKVFYIISCLTALTLLFSVGSILSMTSSILILFSVRRNSGPIKFLIVGVIAIYLLIIVSGIDVSDLPVYKITAYFDQSNYYLTEGSRQEASAAGIKLIWENPLGIGWGTFLQESKVPGSEIDRMIFGSGLISMWLELAVAIGLVGFSLSIYLLWRTLSNISRVNDLPGSSCFVALCSLAFHHFAVFEVWFPMFWFALALSQVLVAQAAEAERHKDLKRVRAGDSRALNLRSKR